MSKAVLLSLQPKWCKLIANGEKTVEVRKTKPNIKTPFKCYIYCTKSSSDILWILNTKERSNYEKIADLIKAEDVGGAFNGNSKVIGEFICDYILGDCESENAEIAEQKGYIKREWLFEYSQGKELYGWHISDLVIYDKPKKLSEFFVIDKKAVNECILRAKITQTLIIQTTHISPGKYICKYNDDFCKGDCWKKSLSRPPQSWCYVEECENNVEI